LKLLLENSSPGKKLSKDKRTDFVSCMYRVLNQFNQEEEEKMMISVLCDVMMPDVVWLLYTNTRE